METRRPLYLSDFMTGLFAALAQRDQRVFSLRKSQFDHAIEGLMDSLKEASEREGLDLRFRIRTHPVHGDSPAIQQALYEAAQRDLVSLDNPEFQDVRLKISREEAPEYLERLPGSEDLYLKLADRFLASYRQPVLI